MSKEEIEKRIYKIRGRQVMLDADLAHLYQVPTKRLNEQVRRNLFRFPSDFMFQLSTIEAESLRYQMGTSRNIRSQIATASKRNVRYLPFAFTEHGVAMLSCVLHSKQAVLVNIAIIRAFIQLRHAVLSSRDVARRVEKLEGKVDVHDTDIRLLVQDVDQLKRKKLLDSPIGPPEIV